MMSQTVPLGVHHRTPVVADFVCSDVCPNYTMKVIHYVLAPGQTCRAVGGAANRPVRELISHSIQAEASTSSVNIDPSDP